MPSNTVKYAYYDTKTSCFVVFGLMELLTEFEETIAIVFD